jgi:hypothetical protein
MVYVNLDNLCNKKKKYYQIQLEKEKLIIKYIGEGDEMVDIAIVEKIGQNNEYEINSCVYEDEDLVSNKLLPLILITDHKRVYSISIIINEDIKIDEYIYNFNILFTQKQSIQKMFPLDKNIDSENIIEVLISKLLDLGIFIL